jgi:hypothetical protein
MTKTLGEKIFFVFAKFCFLVKFRNINIYDNNSPSTGPTRGSSAIRAGLGETGSTMNFLSAMRFLSKYSWMFNYRVTHMLSPSTLDRIPPPWLHFLSNLDIGTTSIPTFNIHWFCSQWLEQKVHTYIYRVPITVYVLSSELGHPHPRGPLFRKRVCPIPPPPGTRGGGGRGSHSPSGEGAPGVGSPNSDDWRKSLALCLLCSLKSLFGLMMRLWILISIPFGLSIWTVQ